MKNATNSTLKKKSIVIALIMLFPLITIAQSRIDSLFTISEAAFKEKKYDKAFDAYLKIKLRQKKGSDNYKYVADQMALIYDYRKSEYTDKKDYDKNNRYLIDYLTFIEREKQYIRPVWNTEKRYVLLRSIIQNYFAANKFYKAVKYQGILKKAHQNKLLPKGMNEYYRFDDYTFENQNVQAYEWFANAPTPGSNKEFHKIVYSIFSQDANGENEKELYRFYVLKVDNLKDSRAEYVLTKYSKVPDIELSDEFWKYKYNTPINYKQLKTDVNSVITEINLNKNKPSNSGIEISEESASGAPSDASSKKKILERLMELRKQKNNE